MPAAAKLLQALCPDRHSGCAGVASAAAPSGSPAQRTGEYSIRLETRSIGATDVTVTTLGLGCGQIGRAPRVSEEAVAATVRTAWDAGVRYFDTAPLYGTGVSEQRVGAALSDQERSDYVLSTKAGRLLVPGSGAELEIEYDYGPDGAGASLEASLERLGLDRVEILLCHDIDSYTHGDAQPRSTRPPPMESFPPWPSCVSRA